MPLSSVPQNTARALALSQLAALESACERIVLPLLGHQMVWRRVGHGPPLVLLHGGHGSWLHWAGVIPELSSRFCLWMPDMPGYGETTLNPTGGLDELVTQLCQSLDTLLGAHTPIGLAGFSFGGLVAAQIAAQRGHIERLVLVGPAGHGGRRRQQTLPLPWRDLDPDRDPDGWVQRMRHNLLAQMVHSETSVDALAIEIQWRGCQQTRFRSKPFSRSAALVPALHSYPGEVLMIWGEHDVTATPDQFIHGACSTSGKHKGLCVAGAGHWLMYELPDTAAALVLRGLGVS